MASFTENSDEARKQAARMTDISIIIVTYNSAAVIAGCLSAIKGASEVIVVDNASSDDSAHIAERMGARVILNPENLGFGPACNIGARAARGDYLLFLNPDATLPPGALHALKAVTTRHPDAAAFGPRLMEGDKPAVFQCETFIDAQKDRMALAHTAPTGDCCVRFLSGAALLCNRRSFDHVGGFDENIFLYYEDDDLCYRLRQNGGQLIYAPEVVVGHQKGKSSARQLRGEFARHYHLAESRIYVSRKYGLEINASGYVWRAGVRAMRALFTLNTHKAARHFGMLIAYTKNRSSEPRKPTRKGPSRLGTARVDAS